MKNEYFRGVVWNKGSVKEDEKINHKYVVVGILVTDTPIEEFEGNECSIDGPAFGLSNALSLIRKGKLKCKIGDATDVLLSLKNAF